MTLLCLTDDVGPRGVLHCAVLDGLPAEAVEEEDDGHHCGGHGAPGQGPVQVRPVRREEGGGRREYSIVCVRKRGKRQ